MRIGTDGNISCMGAHDHESPPGGRHETADERLDRKFVDILQELRVMQTGAQLIAGFLLTLPFQSRFDSLDDLQRTVYLALVLVAGLTTALLLTPVAVHRRLSGAHVKERVVATAHRVVAAALTTLALLISGIVFFTFDVVGSRPVACVAGAGVLTVLMALLLLVPSRLARHRPPPPPENR